MQATPKEAATKDFFVSYTQADRAWAEWIAWTLEGAGYTVIVQAWDFHGGGNFFDDMNQASASARQTLAVLSEAYLRSDFTFVEWVAKRVLDPRSRDRALVPVRVEPCTLPPGLAGITYIDLVGLNRTMAREVLLEQVSGKRRVPLAEPGFPGVQPEPEPAATPVQPYAPLAFISPPLDGGGEELFSVAFSPDGQWIAAGSNAMLLLWDARQPQAPLTLTGPTSYVYSVAFSQDARFLACGCEDKIVRLYDMKARKWLWRPPRGQLPQQMHDDAVYSVAFSPDGTLLASGGYDRRVYLWDALSGDSVVEPTERLNDLGRVTSVAFCPVDGDHLAIGSLDNKLRVWNFRTDKLQLLEGHTSSVESLAFSPDGRYLASGGLDKTVRLWDWRTGKQLWCGAQHEYLVRAVAFAPDGRTLASVSWDKTLRLWDCGRHEHAVQKQMLPLRNQRKPWHSDWIWSVAFAPDGQTLATSGSDGQVLRWRLRR